MNKDFKKILVINTFGIGDVLFTTPLVKNLKAIYPDASIHYICNRRVESVLANDPHIDRVWVYERDEFVAVQKKNVIAFIQKWQGFINDLKKEQFDAVFDLSLNMPMGFLSWAAGIPVRIGYNYRNRGRFLTNSLKFKGFERQHASKYYIDLLQHIGIKATYKPMEIYPSDEDKDWVSKWLASNQYDANRPLIGMVPGGGASWGKSAGLKRWPVDQYAKLADKMVEKFNAQIILMGDQSEQSLASEMSSKMQHPCIIATGQTTITQLAALLLKCTFTVLNDGGPLHIAVAAGAKTVSIFGPVDPNVYGPYPQENHLVITKALACQPCYRRFRMSNCQHKSCLTQLTADEVIRKVEKFYEHSIY